MHTGCSRTCAGQRLHYCIVSNRWQQRAAALPSAVRTARRDVRVFTGTARNRKLHFLGCPGTPLCWLVIVCPAGKDNAHPPVFTAYSVRHKVEFPELLSALQGSPKAARPILCTFSLALAFHGGVLLPFALGVPYCILLPSCFSWLSIPSLLSSLLQRKIKQIAYEGALEIHVPFHYILDFDLSWELKPCARINAVPLLPSFWSDLSAGGEKCSWSQMPSTAGMQKVLDSIVLLLTLHIESYLCKCLFGTGRCNYPVRHQSWCDGGKPMADSSGFCCLLVEATVKDECCFSILSHLWLVGAFSAVGSCQFMCVLSTLSSSLPSWQSYARMEVFCADTLTGVELTAMMGTS